MAEFPGAFQQSALDSALVQEGRSSGWPDASLQSCGRSDRKQEPDNARFQESDSNFNKAAVTSCTSPVLASSNFHLPIVSPVPSLSHSGSSSLPPSSSVSLSNIYNNDIEIQDIMNILVNLEEKRRSPDYNLSLTKTAYGCSWVGSSCSRGDSCPFVAQFLGISHEQKATKQFQRVLVLKQTPLGLVKLQESIHPMSVEEIRRMQAMNPKEQTRQLGLSSLGPRLVSPAARLLQLGDEEPVPEEDRPAFIPHRGSFGSNYQGPVTSFQPPSATRDSLVFSAPSPVPAPYRPPSNAMLVKVPSFPDGQDRIFSANTSPPCCPLLCQDCDMTFSCKRALNKHTRNQVKSLNIISKLAIFLFSMCCTPV